MRHSHGLRAAAGGGIVLPAIGDAYEGGFFVGTISHTANSVPTHALIVAPASSGSTTAIWKTTNTTTVGTSNFFDGAANTAAMVAAGIALHPAAQFCTGLSIGGYTDWYLPALLELDIAYENLKTSTDANDTTAGINAYSVPARTVNRTAGAPAQTSVAAFQYGGAQALLVAGMSPLGHKSSTEFSANYFWSLRFISGNQYPGIGKERKFNSGQPVRAFRKVAV